MRLRSFAFVCAMVALVLAAAGLPCRAGENGEKPHIVLVMADDQGWGDMAYNGHPLVETPNFDEAAASGLRFDRFYAAAPVCSPTRASVLTGRTPNRMGVFKWGHPIRPQERTIAEALKEEGYATGHFGKWHLGSVRKESPVNPGANGFDEWLSAPNFYDNDAVMSDKGEAVPKKGESSFIAVDAALEWMERTVDEGDPVFAVIWFGSPHSPYRAASEDSALYADESKDMREFLGEITGMDRAFGKLRESLDEMGVRENTLLWYTSDNGALPKVGSTGGFRGLKGDVYEGGLLVPAIIEWPAMVKKHRVTDTRCVTSDIYPTLLDIVGAATPPDQPVLDGISLLPLIENAGSDEAGGTPRSKPIGFWDADVRGIGTSAEEWMGELLEAQRAGRDLPPHPASAKAAELPDPPRPADHFQGHAAWIDGDWKLHRIEGKRAGGADAGVKWELYDLAADPKETENLYRADDERCIRMRKALEEWMKSVNGSLNGEDY